MNLPPAFPSGVRLYALSRRWPGLAPTGAVCGDLFDDRLGEVMPEVPIGVAGSARTALRTTAGPPAHTATGPRGACAAPRSRAAEPRAQHPWLHPGAGRPPGSRAASEPPGKPARRSPGRSSSSHRGTPDPLWAAAMRFRTAQPVGRRESTPRELPPTDGTINGRTDAATLHVVGGRQGGRAVPVVRRPRAAAPAARQGRQWANGGVALPPVCPGVRSASLVFVVTGQLLALSSATVAILSNCSGRASVQCGGSV
jgi:hypothetical protein